MRLDRDVQPHALTASRPKRWLGHVLREGSARIPALESAAALSTRPTLSARALSTSPDTPRRGSVSRRVGSAWEPVNTPHIPLIACRWPADAAGRDLERATPSGYARLHLAAAVGETDAVAVAEAEAEATHADFRPRWTRLMYPHNGAPE